jgi:hypothetical protein
MEKRDKIDAMQHETKVYDSAISEIEQKYGHVIFSPAFYSEIKSIKR